MQKNFVAMAVMGLAVLGASSEAFAAGKDGVAAVVNGEKITVAEVKKAYNDNPAIKEKVKFDDFYPRAVDIFVNSKLVAQAADKAKIKDSDEYKQQLEVAKDEIASKIYVEQQVDKKVSKKEIQKLYDEYKKDFKPEKEIKAKHILVDNEKQAKEVIEKLNKGGKFDKLAKEYSREPADLGYFTKNIMVQEFSDAAFALKKGEYSKTPVKSQFGYHVILVEDIRDTKPLSLKEIEPQLKAMLSQNAVASVFKEINDAAKVEKYDLKGNLMK